jgi:cytochrome P450
MMGPEPVDVPMMIWLDPPEHTRLRQLVNRAFTPRAMERLESRIERICGRLLDPFVGTAGFDYVDDFGALLPPTVILEMLGFPEGREQEWRRHRPIPTTWAMAADCGRRGAPVHGRAAR